MADPNGVLDNPAWHALNGPHGRHAWGLGDIRRYGKGFAPIAAFRAPGQANGDELSLWYPSDHIAYVADIDLDNGTWGRWKSLGQGEYMQMILPSLASRDVDEALDIRRLGLGHVPQMMQLIETCKPGPFGPRSHELGSFFGVFVDHRLVAMAGQRFCAPGVREICSVCTTPTHRGQGYASALVRLLARASLQAGELPFLHVDASARQAWSVYESMGFRFRKHVRLHALQRVRHTK